MLSQIIFGILPLNRETWRFRGTELEERTCLICNSQSIEDEFHFLICNEYNELRIYLFNNIKYNKVETFEYLNNRETFLHIMKYEWKLVQANT